MMRNNAFKKDNSTQTTTKMIELSSLETIIESINRSLSLFNQNHNKFSSFFPSSNQTILLQMEDLTSKYNRSNIKLSESPLNELSLCYASSPDSEAKSILENKNEFPKNQSKFLVDFPSDSLFSEPVDALLFAMHKGQKYFDQALHEFQPKSETDELILKNIISVQFGNSKDLEQQTQLNKALDLPLMQCLNEISRKGLLEERVSRRPIKTMGSLIVIILEKLNLGCLSKLVPDFKGNDRLNYRQLKSFLKEEKYFKPFSLECKNRIELKNFLMKNFESYFLKNLKRWKSKIISKNEELQDRTDGWKLGLKIPTRLILNPYDMDSSIDALEELLRQIENEKN